MVCFTVDKVWHKANEIVDFKSHHFENIKFPLLDGLDVKPTNSMITHDHANIYHVIIIQSLDWATTRSQTSIINYKHWKRRRETKTEKNSANV